MVACCSQVCILKFDNGLSLAGLFGLSDSILISLAGRPGAFAEDARIIQLCKQVLDELVKFSEFLAARIKIRVGALGGLLENANCVIQRFLGRVLLGPNRAISLLFLFENAIAGLAKSFPKALINGSGGRADTLPLLLQIFCGVDL